MKKIFLDELKPHKCDLTKCREQLMKAVDAAKAQDNGEICKLQNKEDSFSINFIMI